MQLKSNLSKLEVIISTQILPLNFESIDKIKESQVDNPPKPRVNQGSFSDLREFRKPLDFQAFPANSLGLDELINYFQEEASQGILMHDKQELIHILFQKFRIEREKAVNLLNTAEQNGFVHVTHREFKNYASMEFISLKIEQLSLECLQ